MVFAGNLPFVWGVYSVLNAFWEFLGFGFAECLPCSGFSWPPSTCFNFGWLRFLLGFRFWFGDYCCLVDVECCYLCLVVYCANWCILREILGLDFGFGLFVVWACLLMFVWFTFWGVGWILGFVLGICYWCLSGTWPFALAERLV